MLLVGRGCLLLRWRLFRVFFYISFVQLVHWYLFDRDFALHVLLADSHWFTACMLLLRDVSDVPDDAIVG